MREKLADNFLLRSTLLGELSTPGPDISKHTKGAGAQAPRGGPLSQSGAHTLADSVCLGPGKE